MKSKLDSLAEYLDARRKSSSSETYRMREAEEGKTASRFIPMCAGQSYLNLRTSNVVARKQKFALDYNYRDQDEDRELLDMLAESDEETSDLDDIHSLEDAGHEELGDPPAEDDFLLEDEDEDEDVFGDEDDLFAEDEEKTEMNPYSLPETDLGHLTQRDPREVGYGWQSGGKLASRKQAWLKEAQTEGLFAK